MSKTLLCMVRRHKWGPVKWSHLGACRECDRCSKIERLAKSPGEHSPYGRSVSNHNQGGTGGVCSDVSQTAQCPLTRRTGRSPATHRSRGARPGGRRRATGRHDGRGRAAAD
jgi:hypothetical protein